MERSLGQAEQNLCSSEPWPGRTWGRAEPVTCRGCVGLNMGWEEPRPDRGRVASDWVWQSMGLAEQKLGRKIRAWSGESLGRAQTRLD